MASGEYEIPRHLRSYKLTEDAQKMAEDLQAQRQMDMRDPKDLEAFKQLRKDSSY